MKNKLLLSGLMLLYSASPVMAKDDEMSMAQAISSLGFFALVAYGIKTASEHIHQQTFHTYHIEIQQPKDIEERFNSITYSQDSKYALTDIINYLQDPKKYEELGTVPPKGIILTGNAGIGKKMLAQALAGESNCCFISTTHPLFTDTLANIANQQINHLINAATLQKSYLIWQKPCIIFIDDIDTLSTNSNAIYTLLLTIDCFAKYDIPITIIGSTNNIKNIDSAMLQPGRFERIVPVTINKNEDREALLSIYLKKVKHSANLDIKKIAKETPGFSGKDLENLIKQAAFIAMKKSITEITMLEIDEARDEINIGSPIKSMHLNEYEKKVTAYHEAGHALISLLMPTPLQRLDKVTISPRAMALGVTHFLPEEDVYQLSKQNLLTHIAVALGGRAAEELEFNLITNGPSNDFVQATKMARAMISNYGMTDVLGKQVLLPELTQTMQYSQKTLEKIDEAVTQILEEQFTVVTNLLTEHKDKLDALAQALLEKETLDASEVYQLLNMEPRKDFRLA